MPVGCRRGDRYFASLSALFYTANPHMVCAMWRKGLVFFTLPVILFGGVILWPRDGGSLALDAAALDDVSHIGRAGHRRPIAWPGRSQLAGRHGPGASERDPGKREARLRCWSVQCPGPGSCHNRELVEFDLRCRSSGPCPSADEWAGGAPRCSKHASIGRFRGDSRFIQVGSDCFMFRSDSWPSAFFSELLLHSAASFPCLSVPTCDVMFEDSSIPRLLRHGGPAR